MNRTAPVLVAGVVLGMTGRTAARHDEKGEVKRTAVSATDVTEKVDGKEAKATTVELTLEPGQSSDPHRHPGAVFGYVIEGEYEWAIDDQPAKVLKAGETFYETTGGLHRVSKNPAAKGKTRILAVVLHPRDAKQLTVPEKEAQPKAKDQPKAKTVTPVVEGYGAVVPLRPRIRGTGAASLDVHASLHFLGDPPCCTASALDPASFVRVIPLHRILNGCRFGSQGELGAASIPNRARTASRSAVERVGRMWNAADGMASTDRLAEAVAVPVLGLAGVVVGFRHQAEPGVVPLHGRPVSVLTHHTEAEHGAVEFHHRAYGLHGEDGQTLAGDGDTPLNCFMAPSAGGARVACDGGRREGRSLDCPGPLPQVLPFRHPSGDQFDPNLATAGGGSVTSCSSRTRGRDRRLISVRVNSADTADTASSNRAISARSASGSGRSQAAIRSSTAVRSCTAWLEYRKGERRSSRRQFGEHERRSKPPPVRPKTASR